MSTIQKALATKLRRLAKSWKICGRASLFIWFHGFSQPLHCSGKQIPLLISWVVPVRVHHLLISPSLVGSNGPTTKLLVSKTRFHALLSWCTLLDLWVLFGIKQLLSICVMDVSESSDVGFECKVRQVAQWFAGSPQSCCVFISWACKHLLCYPPLSWTELEVVVKVGNVLFFCFFCLPFSFT